MLKTINVRTSSRSELIDITDKVKSVVFESGIKGGVCYIYVPHTTAGVLINEGADPSVQRDVEKTLSKLIPHNGNYRHAEGNSDSHIKSILTGNSQPVIIESGKLQLGAWQSIFFCEFDGPRQRNVLIKTMEG